MGFEKSVYNFSHNTTSRPATWSVRVVFNLGQRRKICYWGLSTECQSERAYGLFVLLLGSVGDEAHLDHTVGTTVAGEQAGSGRPGAAGVDELLAPAGVESALDHLLLYLVTPAGALDDKFELGLRASFEPAGAGRMFDVVTGRVDRGAADDRVRDRRPAVRVGQTSTLEHEAVAVVFFGVVEAPAAVGNAAFQFGAHRAVRFGRTGVPEVADGKGSADRHRRPVGRVDARLADRRHRIAPSGAAEDERTAPERRAYRQPVAGIVHAAAHFQRQTVVAFDARVPEVSRRRRRAGFHPLAVGADAGAGRQFDAFAVGGDRAPQLVAALAGRLADGDPAVTAVADRACDRHSLARSAPVPDEADPALFAFTDCFWLQTSLVRWLLVTFPTAREHASPLTERCLRLFTRLTAR
ncbi:conserved hypothetical protein [Trichinella spiralis]|uniref:hypothetical protein n=1 Tax=Trichinella spiralis TaxID=6334 RepID=UPI0001EFD390|nr:conserved hypothetical protein [Trichinella spiralis]